MLYQSDNLNDAKRPHPGYIPELDGLRAIACLLVIFVHAGPGGLFAGGFLGVDLFFVLSGYLITNMLVAEWDANGKIAIGQFYLQRALRLAPALLFFLGIYAVVAPFAWPGAPHLRDAGLAALYVTDYSYPLTGSPRYLQHSWSLAVEEQFYLLWPLLIPLIAARRRGIALLAAMWIVVTLWRYSLSDDGWTNYYYFLHTHSSGLIAGAGLALAQREGFLKISASLGTAVLLAFGLMALTAKMTASAVAITLGELLSLLIIGCIVSGEKLPFARILSSKPMVGVGQLSYGLYLWHFPIAYYLRDDFGFLLTASATFGLALTGSFLSYHSVEKWGRAAKTRLKARGIASPQEQRAAPAMPKIV